MLNGIDVSSNQPANICSLVDYDFAIVKATGNPPGYAWDYKNEYMERQAGDVLERGKLLGFYHFTYGLEDAKREAKLFADAVKPYIGEALLAIDYEGPAVDNAGRKWLVGLCREVKRLTGITPLVYASSSVISSQGLIHTLVNENNIGLWSANYWSGSEPIYGYSYADNRLVNDCPEAAIWQYTGTGILPGYDGYLDLDCAYMDGAGWGAYASGGGADSADMPDAGKTPMELAEAVIRGDYGTGRERREKLGDDYGAVQAIVDIKLGYEPISDDVKQAADMVIAGRYSNGLKRAALLGPAYQHIQQEVDRRYGA